MILTASLLRAQQNRDSVENKPASLLVESLSKTLNGMPPFSYGRQMVGRAVYPSWWPSLTEDSQTEHERTALINSRLNVVVRSPAPFGLGRNDCWSSRGSQLPRALPFVFSLCCPLNDRRRAAHSLFKIGRLFSLFLLYCPSFALLRLLILLLLLMSGNVHSNPGPIFPCSVCAGNVTWRGKSVQCCASPNGSI